MPQPNYEFVLQAKFPRNMEKKSQVFGLKVEEKNYKTIFLREQTAWKYSYCKLYYNLYLYFFHPPYLESLIAQSSVADTFTGQGLYLYYTQ